jgi:hypothetical protein
MMAQADCGPPAEIDQPLLRAVGRVLGKVRRLA